MDPGSPGIVVGLLVLSAEVFVAMVTIIFYISVILRDFHIRKKLESKDQILLALKVSSFIFTIVMTYSAFPNILQPDFSRMSHLSSLFTVAIVYCMCSCTWLIALLCFIFFIKIVHFQWAFISWVKRMMDSSTSWLIVVVELMSLSIGLFHLLPYVSSTNSSDISSTFSTTGHMAVYDSVTYLLLIVICPSIVLSTIANLVTAAFLKCHANKMKDTNTTGDVHQYIHVVQTLLLFLFLYSVFYVMLFLYYFSFFAPFSIGYWINLILVFLFMPTANVLQIYKTPHLRTTWKELFKPLERT